MSVIYILAEEAIKKEYENEFFHPNNEYGLYHYVRLKLDFFNRLKNKYNGESELDYTVRVLCDSRIDQMTLCIDYLN